MNAEAAAQSLQVARRKLEAGEFASAVRFAKKSLALARSDEAERVLREAEAGVSGGGEGASSSATSAGPSASSTSKRGGGAAPSSSSSSASSSKPSSSAGAGEKPGGGGAHTPAQAAMVARVKKCRVTAYYEILELQKSCSEGEVKKAYRKRGKAVDFLVELKADQEFFVQLALGLHPDKNLAPGAEEAFKMVSKAFTVLSDPQKRAIFDQTGGDPDSRGGGGGGGGGGGFAGGGMPRYAGSPFGGGGNYGGRGEEISPEDLFRAFFGGSMGGGVGGFGAGGPMGFGGPLGGGLGGSTFHFFGPGMGGGMPTGQGFPPRRAGAQRQDEGHRTSPWVQMAPLLLLFAFSFLTQLPSLFGGSGRRLPEFSFERTARFSHPRTTTSGVSYFVDPSSFPLHPSYRSFLRAIPNLGFNSAHAEDSRAFKADLVAHFRREVEEKGEGGKTAEPVKETEEGKEKEKEKRSERLRVPNDFAKFERQVEKSWVGRLQAYCRHELNQREEKLERARGFLGIGTDHAAIARITKERLHHCEELSKVPGYQVQYR
ncbi:Chaperone protein dnaJ [Rhodosporidiobolus nylandii]